MKRVKTKQKDHNPLITKWLEEWRDEAKEKNLKTHFTYSKALSSLKKYPITVQLGSELKILNGFGDKICGEIQKKIDQHKALYGNDVDLARVSEPDSDSDSTAHVAKKKSKTSSTGAIAKPRGSRKGGYTPAYRSGPYALLLTLYVDTKKPVTQHYMTKQELLIEAQPLADFSFTIPEPGSKYTAWSSMGSLIKKSLITKSHSPARYALTNEGMLLAEKLVDMYKEPTSGSTGTQSITVPRVPSTSGITGIPCVSLPSVPSCSSTRPSQQAPKTTTHKDLKSKDNRNPVASSISAACSLQRFQSSSSIAESSKSRSSMPTYTWTLPSKPKDPSRNLLSSDPVRKVASLFTLEPGKFEIILCVDNTEVFGTGASKETLIKELQKQKLKVEVRKLQLGDFLFIARPRSDKGDKEVVLDYIIERKRMDDLASSIIDGRFKEQKHRILNSGINNRIYLVESYGSLQHLSMSEHALEQAIANTQIIDQLHVKRTKDMKDTVRYLSLLESTLQAHYSHVTINAVPREDLQPSADALSQSTVNLLTFKDFDEFSVKTKALSVRDMFGKQLMVLAGLTAEKAGAIVRQYPTPALLMSALQSCADDKARIMLLNQIKYGITNRSLGQQLCKNIMDLYCKMTLS